MSDQKKELSPSRLEDAPWFELDEACHSAEKAGMGIGSIKPIMVWCGPENCHIQVWALQIIEGGDKYRDRYRFFMLQKEALAARVARGLEPNDNIILQWNAGTQVLTI